MKGYDYLLQKRMLNISEKNLVSYDNVLIINVFKNSTRELQVDKFPQYFLQKKKKSIWQCLFNF